MTTIHAIAAGLPLVELELELEEEAEREQSLRPPVPPAEWITERLGEHLWSKQREIVESVEAHRHTAVHSCHDSGKSFIAARLAAWWLSTHTPGEAFVVTTAPTGRQVRAILWREIGRAHARGKLPGRVNQTEWWMDALGHEEIVGFGLKPSDYDPAAFQGIHARYALVIIDEASGVPENIFNAAEALITNEGSRILAIGNPDDPMSYFATTCKPASGWNVIHIDGLETPNFTDEDVPDLIREELLSRVWVEERKAKWGEESPLYIAKVRGQFPEDASDGVIPLSWIRRCQQEVEGGAGIPVELGVDVGAGGDWTVVRERRGAKAGRSWRARTPEASQAAGLVMQAIAETGATRVKVDSIGVGWGIVGRLKELRSEGAHKAEIVPVNVGAASRDPSRFPRLRDQLWWELGRELSQSGGWDLTDVDDDTVAQLIAPKYSPDSAGRVKVEPKDETIKRIGHSPDDADALLLAFYVGQKFSGLDIDSGTPTNGMRPELAGVRKREF